MPQMCSVFCVLPTIDMPQMCQQLCEVVAATCIWSLSCRFELSCSSKNSSHGCFPSYFSTFLLLYFSTSLLLYFSQYRLVCNVTLLLCTVLMHFWQYLVPMLFLATLLAMPPRLILQRRQVTTFVTTLLTPSQCLSMLMSLTASVKASHHFRNHTCRHFSPLVTTCHCLSLTVNAS